MPTLIKSVKQLCSVTIIFAIHGITKAAKETNEIFSTTLFKNNKDGSFIIALNNFNLSNKQPIDTTIAIYIVA